MSKQYKSINDLPDWVKMITGGIAGSVAEAITIPIDTAKVRLQIQKPDANGKYRYHGLLHTTRQIYSEEGVSSLFKGLSAGIQRQLVFASIRIGLYEPMRDFFCGKDFKGDPPLSKKIYAGLATGGIGISIASPFDVIKVRFQVDGNLPVEQRRYKNLTDAYIKIYKQDGLHGFWRGVTPNIIRNAVINCAELATFDHIKESLIKTGLFHEGLACHFASSVCAGFIAAVVGQPVDLIKTRVMNQNVGVLTVVKNIIKNEGVMNLYNGFSANAGRIITWNICMFVTLGQVRLFALNNFYKSPE
ncbi:unnamed protein product [Paramecium octaurelia]|uniref:Uncharacterized protein n=1 Tax=Paramecium octaurelia TaxID=43137 RepID=A0A8S1XCH7_PAROT|nr:unnamed protein product [Paramecium octaurelia]